MLADQSLCLLAARGLGVGRAGPESQAGSLGVSRKVRHGAHWTIADLGTPGKDGNTVRQLPSVPGLRPLTN